MPKIRKGETSKGFIKRCIPVLITEGKPQNQAIAVCHSIAEKRGR